MAIQPIRIPSLLGGVSTVSQSQRTPVELEAMENCDSNLVRGVDKRPGTEHIAGAGTTEALDVAEPANDAHTFWINRSSTERFVGFIDPTAAVDTDVIQVFNIVTGAEVVVKALDSGGSEVDLDDADADVTAMVAYLKNGSQVVRQRYRTISVEDSTFILNRTVTTALEGTAITYRNSLSPVNVRNQANGQNVVAWSDLDQPPTTTATYPTRATLVAGGTITDDAIWHAREDDVGLPQGFYWAISGTQPPWYQRLPTESANSYVQRDTMPLRLAFDGTKFVLQLVDWVPRKSGDGTTNPGPTFIGNALDDFAFHQNRLWFSSGERIVSTRAGDLFNLWIDSITLVTDADPIDTGVQGRRISNVNLLEAFRESLIGITDGARQMELRANGPITPLSFQIYDSTNVFSANYVKPVVRGSQLLFAGERDFSMIVWEYDYDPGQVSNIARDLTERVHGYMTAEAHWFAASDAHDQMFILTLADVDTVYVNKVAFGGGERFLNSWYKWTYPTCDEIISVEVFDDYLYMVMKRDSLWFLERQGLGEPAQENDGSQTLNYALRMDRKVEIQGVYSAGSNETVFTLPYLDATATYQVVLGPSWDTASVKAAGMQIQDFTVATAGGVTTLTFDGDYENNADGTNAPAYVGVQYTASAELSELFVRDAQGVPLHGNTHLMRMKVRHRDSGGYSVEVTPEGRSALTKDYVVPTIGSSPIDGDQLDDFGEFQVRLMCHSRNARIRLLNDTPFPTAWVDCEVHAEFIPDSYSPVR